MAHGLDEMWIDSGCECVCDLVKIVLLSLELLWKIGEVATFCTQLFHDQPGTRSSASTDFAL